MLMPLTAIPVRARPGALSVDLALAVVALKRRLAYRLNWVFSVVLGGGELLVSLTLWGTILAEQGSVAGYDWDAMRTYYVIGFVTGTFIFSGSDTAQRILDGSVAIDLLKPVDFQRARAAEFYGGLAGSLPTMAVGLTIALIFFTPLPPASFAAGLLTLVSIALIAPIAFSVVYLSTMLCFWTRSYQGVMWARQTVVAFFSGAMVPLAIMPEPMQVLAWCLPFVHFTTTPSQIYLGRVDALGALGLIAAQLAWVVALWFLGRWLWSRAVRAVTIHGG
jgi:ABC-2 type transport system permease protein